MLTSKRRLKVYAYCLDNDQELVNVLCGQMALHGVEIVRPGVVEPEEQQETSQKNSKYARFLKATQEADVILFCLSELFDDMSELESAEWYSVLEKALEKRHGDLFIIPVRLEACQLPVRLKRWQPINLYEMRGYEALMQALKVRADKLGAELTPEAGWQDNPFEIEPEPVLEEIPRRVPRGSFFLMGIVGAALLFIVVILFQVNTNKATVATQTALSVNSLAEKATQNIAVSATVRAATLTAEAFRVSERRIQTEVFLTGVPSTKTAMAEQALVTPTITFTSVAIPTQIMDAGNILMVLVPDGNFIMGLDGSENASPGHSLQLRPYYIDQYEVTNASYRDCVNAGACQPPALTASQTRPEYYDGSAFTDYPVINVDWYAAQAYCEWRGARLPTEAEWEKAARGTAALVYPWGDETGCFLANYDQCVGDTSTVDKYAIGRSVYGVFNMAGDVAEWTSSLLMPYPYLADDGREDLASSGPRVLRGGSWASPLAEISTYYRLGLEPAGTRLYGNDVGFRCARNATP